MKKTKESIVGIYIIMNLVNKKVYIGQSINMNERIEDHKYKLRKNIHHNKHLQNSWNKYGEKNFIFYSSHLCSVERLTWNEQKTKEYFEKCFGVYNKGIFVDSPNKGRKFPAEMCGKISKANINRYQNGWAPRKGKKHKPETIEIFKQNNLGEKIPILVSKDRKKLNKKFQIQIKENRVLCLGSTILRKQRKK